MSDERDIRYPDPERAEFFRGLAMSARSELKVHKAAGLWGERGTREDWRNVTEHCAVEVARVGVMAELLGLSADIQQDLVTAAWLHDAGKKEEITLARSMGTSFQSFVLAEEKAAERLFAAGYSERVVRLATSVGSGALHQTQAILSQSSRTEDDTAFLIMHYIDDITSDNDAVSHAEVLSNGQIINDLDRRMDKNERNKNYFRLNEEGRAFFGGKTTLQMQREIGHQVEGQLFTLLQERNVVNLPDHPAYLPEFIEEQVNYKIYK